MDLRRREFLLLGSGILVTTLFGCDSSSYKENLSFEIAKQNKNLRPRYLERVSKELKGLEFFDSLVYDSTGEKEIDYVARIMLNRDKRLTPEIAQRAAENYLKEDPGARVPQIFTECGLGNKSPIFVRDSIFEKNYVRNDKDLLFVLKEHEYIHAEDQAKGPRIGNYKFCQQTAVDMVSGKVEPALLTIFVELRALANQFNKLYDERWKGVSKEMADFVKREYRRNVLAVRNYSSREDLNNYLREQILNDFVLKE